MTRRDLCTPSIAKKNSWDHVYKFHRVPTGPSENEWQTAGLKRYSRIPRTKHTRRGRQKAERNPWNSFHHMSSKRAVLRIPVNRIDASNRSTDRSRMWFTIDSPRVRPPPGPPLTTGWNWIRWCTSRRLIMASRDSGNWLATKTFTWITRSTYICIYLCIDESANV